MRFHVVGLPHTNVTADFSACAYTDRVRKFCAMMIAQGHEVFLYAGPKSDALCDEHIPCLSEDERAAAVGDGHYTAASFNAQLPHWQTFNGNVIREMRKRIQPRDYICVVGGLAHQPIAAAFPGHITVEFAVGYTGVFSNFRVFESYAWMHTIYGWQNGADSDGRFFDAVIPPGFELDQYQPRVELDTNYLGFLGRLVDRKGFQIAVDVAKSMGEVLITAGPGTPPDPSCHMGVIGPETRSSFLRNAKALLVPTRYIEPFGNVAVEAMLCGTPAITTDWGAFTETVIHGVTGFRCRTMGEFREAVLAAPQLGRARIAAYARKRYSMETVAKQYEEHFHRLNKLWEGGFNA